MLCMECSLIRSKNVTRMGWGSGASCKAFLTLRQEGLPQLGVPLWGFPYLKIMVFWGFISGPEECDAGGSIGRNPADE